MWTYSCSHRGDHQFLQKVLWSLEIKLLQFTLFPSVLPTSISFSSHSYPTGIKEQTGGMLEKMNREQEARPQTPRELSTDFSVKEGCSSFPICSHCSWSCVNGSIATYKFWESSAMHKQLLKYVKVAGLNKKTPAAPHFLWDKGKEYGKECGTDREAISFLI